MNIGRKIARRMAKAQMRQFGIQHPCREHGGRGTSYFAAHWKRFAAKRRVALSL